MTYKVSTNQFDYLSNGLGKAKPELLNGIQVVNTTGDHIYFTIDSDDITLEIFDWVAEELQLKGFDRNYELTAEGKILEDLIDILNE